MADKTTPPSNKGKLALEIFLTFFKIGAVTIGGGYAMIPVMYSEFVDRKGWIQNDELLEMTAIGESTPGPIAINCATFIGYRLLGVWGAAVATLATALPSFIIIFCISLFFNNILENRIVAGAFKGIKACVAVLITKAAFKMIKSMEKTTLAVTILVFSVAAMLAIDIFALNFSTILLILAGAVVGLCANAIMRTRRKS